MALLLPGRVGGAVAHTCNLVETTEGTCQSLHVDNKHSRNLYSTQFLQNGFDHKTLVKNRYFFSKIICNIFLFLLISYQNYAKIKCIFLLKM